MSERPAHLQPSAKNGINIEFSRNLAITRTYSQSAVQPPLISVGKASLVEFIQPEYFASEGFHCPGRVDICSLVAQVRHGPGIIANDNRSMSIPDCDDRALVFDRPLFKLLPLSASWDLKDIAEEG